MLDIWLTGQYMVCKNIITNLKTALFFSKDRGNSGQRHVHNPYSSQILPLYLNVKTHAYRIQGVYK